MSNPRLSRRTVVATAALGLALPRAARAADAPPVTNRILLQQNRLWVGAAIGDETLLFVIDTGAPMSIIRPEIARRLKLRVVGNRVIIGLGKKQTASEIVVAPELVFGKGIRLGQVAFTTYDFESGIPADAAGLLSAGLFTGYDSEFDIEAGTWTVWRDGRDDHEGLAQMDARIVPAPRPGLAPEMIVNATIDGVAYKLKLDTGAPNGVLLKPRAARRSGLFDDSRPFAPELIAGFGGLAAKPGRMVRAGRFDMAPLSIDRPLIIVSDPDQRDDGNDDGLVGLKIITALKLVTDRRRNALWAAPTGKPPAAQSYRLGGLWFDKSAAGGATIAMVGRGSPAEAAGIRRGDVVTDPPTFAQALQRVNGPAGKQVMLGINGGAKTWTLAPWL